jgi:hypothetical protein
MAVTMARYVALIVIDIAVVIGLSVGIGAWAPRWPAGWLSHDTFPLALMPWEKPAFYRRLGVARLARRLPELGSTFGGASKTELPGRSASDLARYLREVRRAEWVHWLSCAVTIVLFTFNPWWLALTFVVAVTVGNLPFILVLRNNRLRLIRIIEMDGGRT